jgi:hypothetical protein
MNIEHNFNNAKFCLDIARDKVASQNYEAALAALAKAYSHTRTLLDQVCKLKVLKDEVTRSAGEDSGGPS